MKRLNEGQMLSETVKVIERFFRRLLGLMSTKGLPPAEALLLKPCRSIHTFFMNYSIDDLNLDSNNRVAAVSEKMRLRNFEKRLIERLAVVEMPSRTFSATETKMGQAVQFQSENRSDLDGD
ncbi:MAG TPA: DUF192 domain-containing protein [Bacillales bacterium]|nr:DUF192 domain-containing protein [Bacillales bacterium]